MSTFANLTNFGRLLWANILAFKKNKNSSMTHLVWIFNICKSKVKIPQFHFYPMSTCYPFWTHCGWHVTFALTCDMTCDIKYDIWYEMWPVILHVTFHTACDMCHYIFHVWWHVTWHVTYAIWWEIWHVTFDAICDMCKVTCDIWCLTWHEMIVFYCKKLFPFAPVVPLALVSTILCSTTILAAKHPIDMWSVWWTHWITYRH